MKLLVDSEIKIRPLLIKDAPALTDAVVNHFDYMIEWMWFPILISNREYAKEYIREMKTGFNSKLEREYAVLYKDSGLPFRISNMIYPQIGRIRNLI